MLLHPLPMVDFAFAQVAVGSGGSVFVSDGYCNHRVAEFHANGTHAGDFEGNLQTPHAVALDECKGRLYVASRESKEIVIFDLATRKETGEALPAASQPTF